MDREVVDIVVDLIRIYEWHVVPSLRDPELTDEERSRIHQRALDWVSQQPDLPTSHEEFIERLEAAIKGDVTADSFAKALGCPIEEAVALLSYVRLHPGQRP